MRIRVQADHDLNRAVVRAVVRREPSVDFRSAQAARPDNLPDPEVLTDSARTGRILVSHDFQTIGLAVDTFILVWAATDPSEWENRRRRLAGTTEVAKWIRRANRNARLRANPSRMLPI